MSRVPSKLIQAYSLKSGDAFRYPERVISIIRNEYMSHMKDRKIWNLRTFWGLLQYQYIFVFSPLQIRWLCPSTSMASRKVSTVFLVNFWVCNNISWLQALQRYQNHISKTIRKHRAPYFEKTATSPAFWILLLLVPNPAFRVYIRFVK